MSITAVIGLALSVAILSVVMAVINGFEREFRDRILGIVPHLEILGTTPFLFAEEHIIQLRNIEGVEGVTPIIRTAGLASVSGATRGVLIVGISQESYHTVSDLGSYIEGSIPVAAGGFSVAIGAGVSKDLGLSIGDRLNLIVPIASRTPFGLVPRQRQFQVTGVIDSNSMLDSRAVYINLGDAQKFLRFSKGEIDGYQLRVKDIFSVSGIGHDAIDVLGDRRLYPLPWTTSYGALYNAIGVQKSMMFVLLSLLIGVAAFNLISTLVMVVDQRKGDAAILKTMGADDFFLLKVFFSLGALISISGVGIGLGLGWFVCQLLPWIYLTLIPELMGEYFINYLPVQIIARDLIRIAAVAFLLCFLSTLYPVLRVVRQKPAEVLSHE